TLPLGYDKPRDGTRTLVVNDEEAQRVRDIFARYLELGSVHALQRDLQARKVLSKRYVTNKGKVMGGLPFSRGALFYLLRNQVSLGKIVHKGKVYEGEHEAIVDRELFERVQAKLDRQKRRHTNKARKRQIQAPLLGKLFDEAGERMSPTTAQGKTGRTYRYYVSASLQQGSGVVSEDIVQRISAPEIERVLNEALRRWSPKTSDPFGIIHSVHIGARGLQVIVDASVASSIAISLDQGEAILDRGHDTITVLLPVLFPTRGGQRLIIPAAARPPQPDAILIAALRKAHAMLTTQRGMPLIGAAPASPYDRAILRLALLAPDIQRAILDGRQPHHLNLQAFRKMDIPLSWSAQRKALGFVKPKTGVSGEKMRELGD
ncbi:MAG: recombinase family protein, partial [Pseudomonadota bacterium]